MNCSGITLFHQKEKAISSIDKNLIAGFLSALLSTLQTSNEDIQAIKFKDSKIIFYYRQEPYDLIFLTRVKNEKEKRVYKELRTIAEMFINKYDKELKEWCGNLNIFKDFGDALKKYFYNSEIDL